MKIGTIPKGNLVAEIELTYTPRVKLSTLPKIENSFDAYEIFLENWDKSKLEFVEQFKVLLVNRANKVIGICTLSTGCGSGTVVDVKMLFAVALKSNASGIVIAHNHPSGKLIPSDCDIAITKKVDKAGELLELPLLDHLIITIDGFYSFKDKGAF